MSIQTDTRVQDVAAGIPSSGIRGVDRRARDLQLRDGFLPERRKLVAVLVRDPNTGDARCSIFPDFELAERFISATIKIAGRQAFLAYWTLGEKPELPQVHHGEGQAEVVVVSRSGEALELVKPLTFPDMETARAYFERDREREIAAARASIFWALSLQIRRDATGTVRLTPPSPGAGSQTSDQFEQLRGRAPVLSTGAERYPSLPKDGGQIVSVRSVLSVERWPVRAPRQFSGFHSPPGKF